MAVVTFAGSSDDFIRGELNVPAGVAVDTVTADLQQMLTADSCYLSFRRLHDDGLMIDHPVRLVTTPGQVRSLLVWEES